MKHLFLQFKSTITLILTLLPALSQAEPVDLLLARRQAESIIGKPMLQLQPAETRSLNACPPKYYIFRASDGIGFCIMAADDVLPPILGYSRESHVTQAEAIPDALKLYLQNIALLEGTEAYSPSQNTEPSVEPLCPCDWGQDAPYNNLCPKKNGQTCPTGCVATALAQIMYHWQWPKQGKGYSWAKDGNGATYSGTLEHTYDWAAMRPTTGENLNSEAASIAVATLLYDCGLSVNMNYDTDGSGAVSPIKALSTNFGYIPTTLRIHHRECYTAEEWMALIKNELIKGRPIYYAAASETNGGKDAAGHAFVIDGYDTGDNVHINWGWDGTWNGYFPLARMNPGSYKFNLRQQMTIGIEPARNGETGTPIEYPYIGEDLKCNVSGSIQKSQTFTVTVANISNPNANSHSWQLSMGIYDITGQLLGEVKSGRVPPISLEPGYYLGSGVNITCKISDNYSDGLYAIRLMFREAGTEKWLLPDMVGGWLKNGIYIKIANKRVFFTDGTEYIATAVNDLQQKEEKVPNAAGLASDNLTRVYDTAGRLVYTAPTRQFNLWDVPARGILVVKQGNKARTVVR